MSEMSKMVFVAFMQHCIQSTEYRVSLFASVPYKGFLRYNVHVNCNRLGIYCPI